MYISKATDNASGHDVKVRVGVAGLFFLLLSMMFPF
jgi:hypothetical protein